MTTDPAAIFPATFPATFGADWVTAMLRTMLGDGDAGCVGAAAALTELDRRSGDGDFGTNLTSAFRGVRREIDATAPRTYLDWLTAVSRGFLDTGGTSGPLFGMYFRDLARCSDRPSPTVDEFGAGLRAGVETVQRYGKAEVGHKTMVDALAPAAEAFTAAAPDPVTATVAAADAALRGARQTADIVARRGRSSYVGEVSRGVVDPGAAAAALVLRCAARAAAGDPGPADIAWLSD